MIDPSTLYVNKVVKHNMIVLDNNIWMKFFANIRLKHPILIQRQHNIITGNLPYVSNILNIYLINIITVKQGNPVIIPISISDNPIFLH